MDRPWPRGASIRVTAKLAPWSEERASRTPPLLDPPIAASQARYTLSRNGLARLVSAVIMGLSLKWFWPPEKLKNVTLGYVRPPFVERATAISVPLMPPKFLLKKTTIYP